MRDDIKNTSSDWLNRAIDILFCTHPKRTSLGFVVGALIYVILGVIFAPIWSEIDRVKLSDLELWHYLIIGVSLMHIPTIKDSYTKESELPKEIEQALGLIKEAEAQGVSKKSIQKMRLELCDSVVKSLSSRKSQDKQQTS
ncbi:MULTISPECIES: hypothetical protein [Vibrio]|uniref:Uncharacterized protein n=1 Tax=Vibrio paracholerae TaxID=650003 RepID=A0ABX9FEM4_9VIBR|nr:MULTISPECIES: hypothetical protein [Vibrio]EGR2123908.1 hypothetical protein [Vibrio cholerae]MBY3674260.1 hypothetical protein [Vibrio cholerae]PAS02925.1 hypothetical protein CGT78_19280 [Vibrio cholerae]PAS16314.1 hypothetical protein CGT74_18435 [Vibrio cholerae]RBM52068.1 hypothetical protein DLR69_15365 [Vibrio paracholerae]